jgi:hypothetical protein
MIVDPEELNDPESQSYFQWSGPVSDLWYGDSPVVVIGEVDGFPVAARLGDPDPDTYSEAWNGSWVDPFDPATYTPKPLSEIRNRLRPSDHDGTSYERIYDWHDAEVVNKA